MTSASYAQTNFLGGEWSKTVQGRFDRPDYRTALNVCLNGLPIEEGAFVRRGGSKFVCTTRRGNAGRLITFDFKSQTPYNMEFTDSYLRFIAGNSLVATNDEKIIASVSTATPAKVATTLAHGWSTGNVVAANSLGVNNPQMHNRQFEITVTSATEFTLKDPVTQASVDGTTLGTFVSGNIRRVKEIATPYTDALWPSLRSVQADLRSVLLQSTLVPRVLTVTAQPTSSAFAEFSLASADFLDGPYYDVVDGGNDTGGATITPSAKTGTVTLTASAASGTNFSGFQTTDVGRLIRLFSEPPLFQEGVGHDYVVGDVVKYDDVYWIALKAVTGAAPGGNKGGTNTPGVDLTKWSIKVNATKWTWAQIATRSSTTVCTALIRGDDLFYTSAIRVWRMGLYSDTTGYPTCGTYHEGRLWLAGTVGNRVDGSKSNDIFNFAPTDKLGTVADNNAVAAVFNAPDINTIFWMVPDHLGIVCGTQGGEWLIQASAQNNPLTPTSIQAHRVTKNGCANIEPRRTGLTLAVVHRYRRKMLEYFADVYSGKFTAHNLSLTAKHVTAGKIAEIAYQNELAPVIWARDDAGGLFGCTYKRESLVSSQPPDFAGWHRHTLASSRTVESLCVGASTDGTLDTLAMITNSGGVRHVEIMADLFEEADAIEDACLLDNSVAPSSYSVSGSTLTITGLWHLNGKTGVSVFAGGVDLGPNYTVANGAISVTIGSLTDTFNASFISAFAGAMPIIVGFQYNTDGQIVRPIAPQEAGAQNGPALAKTRRTHQFGALLSQSGPIKFGTDFSKMHAAKFMTPGDTKYTALQLFSGIYHDSLEDEYSFDSQLCWRNTGALPSTVVAVGPFLQTQDR